MMGAALKWSRAGKVISGLLQVVALGALLAATPMLATAATVPPNNTKLTTKTEVLAEKRVLPMLTEQSAGQLETLAERYRNIVADGGFPKVPVGTYKKGKSSKGVAALNHRLYMEGYLRVEGTQGEFESVYTSATEDAVRKFQRNMGLEQSGKVDTETLKALNVPAGQRLRTIEANIERLRIYAEGLGDRYLVVNVPSQQIEAVNGGYVYSRHNAVVGRPDRPTPVVATALSDVIFNPYWNAPASIVEKDIIPKLISHPDVLEEMNIKVFQGFGGPEVDPRSVNWRSAIADDYHFRQEPGEGNAMATAKINFPSPFGIYLHDTPDKVYFTTGHRFYSSGCVRVDKVAILLDWILNGQDGLGSAEIAAYAETLENREVKLVEAPQLRVTYLTAWPVGNAVAFRDDVYELDGTGFTVGQPLPVGELSEEGQRFVLKPVARKAAAVDAAEFEGINLLGGKSKKKVLTNDGAAGAAPPAPGKRKFLMEDLFGDGGSSAGSPTAQPAKKKPAVASAKGTAPATAAGKKAAAAKKKDTPGLFDWEAYRKKQKAGGTAAAAGAKKPAKKVVAASATKPAADAPAKKAAAAKKTAPADAKKAAATTATPNDGKKVPAAKSDPAKAGAEKPAAKKPAAKTPEDCKPAADGKLPAGCKAAAVKKVKPVVPAADTAAN